MCLQCSISRRTFLAGLGALGIGAAGTVSAFRAEAAGPGDDGPLETGRPTAVDVRSPTPSRSGAGPEILAAGAVLSAQSGGMVIGEGGYRYRVEENWPRLPEGLELRDAPAVCVDASDNVYVFTRGDDPVLVFDRDGNIIRSWMGREGAVNTHGAQIGPDGNIYMTDHFGHCLRKCDPKGKVLMTIGLPGQSSPRFSNLPFNACTHSALSPDGHIFISDGYGNNAVHKYTPDGRHVKSWGTSGTREGEFQLPHNICCDDEGWVYVADRENHRIQIFDGEGRYETQWKNLARPCGLFVHRGPDPAVIVGELGPEAVGSYMAGIPNVGPRLSVLSSDGKFLALLGTEPLGEAPNQFIAPHSIAVDSRGDIYVGEVANTYWGILFGSPAPHALRSLRKLVRL